MIKHLTSVLFSGLKQLQLNAHYLLVAFLVLVLPAIFIIVAQSFFSAAYENTITVEKRSVNRLHDSVALLLQANQTDLVSEYLSRLVAEEDRLTAAKLLQQTNRNLLVVASHNRSQVGDTETEKQIYNLAAGVSGDSLIFELQLNEIRTWQAVREVFTENATYYIFTEHSFAEIDAVMANRQQQVYLYLSLVFLFLLSLAYWLVKQTHWQKQFATTKQKLSEQMMFANTIAHELRAPLTAIRGYNSFLGESKALPPEEQSYVQNIKLSTDRLLALINDFLSVARIQSNQLQIRFIEIDVRKILRAVETELSPLARNKGLDFNLKLPNKPVIAETDPERLQQVITNLVSNALKYTKEGSVSLELSQTKLRTIIAIKDTGLGIAGEDQKKLFQAFSRVGKADQSGVTGTGLGMWITQQLVSLLHGTITVESIEGIGTHLKLTFDV